MLQQWDHLIDTRMRFCHNSLQPLFLTNKRRKMEKMMKRVRARSPCWSFSSWWDRRICPVERRRGERRQNYLWSKRCRSWNYGLWFHNVSTSSPFFTWHTRFVLFSQPQQQHQTVCVWEGERETEESRNYRYVWWYIWWWSEMWGLWSWMHTKTN